MGFPAVSVLSQSSHAIPDTTLLEFAPRISAHSLAGKHDMGMFAGRNSQKVRGGGFQDGFADGNRWGRPGSRKPLTFWGPKTVSRFRKPAISLYFGTIRYSGLCARDLRCGRCWRSSWVLDRERRKGAHPPGRWVSARPARPLRGKSSVDLRCEGGGNAKDVLLTGRRALRESM